MHGSIEIEIVRCVTVVRLAISVSVCLIWFWFGLDWLGWDGQDWTVLARVELT